MFSRLFLIGSFSYLQVKRTYIKAYMSLNFGQIPPLTTELAALERLKHRCHHVISVDIDPIFFKLACNKDMHNIMNEFEFRPDRTTDYGVSCPWASKKYPHRPYNGENGVSTFSLLFLIGSFWYFHVTRKSIKAWMSSNFLKWDLTLAHWTQVSNRCPLGYLLVKPIAAPSETICDLTQDLFETSKWPMKPLSDQISCVHAQKTASNRFSLATDRRPFCDFNKTLPRPLRPLCDY